MRTGGTVFPVDAFLSQNSLEKPSIAIIPGFVNGFDKPIEKKRKKEKQREKKRMKKKKQH
jgi:hypothetical protein